MSIFKRLFSFFHLVHLEMKKVSWLSKKETVNQTLTVVCFVLIMSIFFGLSDYIISLMGKLFDQLFFSK